METRDFFISYDNNKDTERAEWIVRILREHGFTVNFQKDGCTSRMDFLNWMDEAIRKSRRTGEISGNLSGHSEPSIFRAGGSELLERSLA